MDDDSLQETIKYIESQIEDIKSVPGEKITKFICRYDLYEEFLKLVKSFNEGEGK